MSFFWSLLSLAWATAPSLLHEVLPPNQVMQIEFGVKQIQTEGGIKIAFLKGAPKAEAGAEALPDDEEDPDPSDRDTVYVWLDPSLKKVWLRPGFGTIEKISRASADEWALAATAEWSHGNLLKGLAGALENIAEAYEVDLDLAEGHEPTEASRAFWVLLTLLFVGSLVAAARWAGSKEVLWVTKTVGGKHLEVVVTNRWPPGNLDKRAILFLTRLRPKRGVDTLMLVDRRTAQVGIAGESLPGNPHSRLKQIAEDELGSTAIGRALDRTLARVERDSKTVH